MGKINHFDFDAFNRAFIGFDELFTSINQNTQGPTYPPYNIVKNSDEQYDVEVAVAGFSKKDISIQTVAGELTITGSKEKTDRAYVHHGISNRSFTRKFKLSEYIEVSSATLENGILKISLLRNVPDAKKPRIIDIN